MQLASVRTWFRCPLWVTSDKTHIEHNETALDLIADMPGDMDFCCNGPQAVTKTCRSPRHADVATKYQATKAERSTVPCFWTPGPFAGAAFPPQHSGGPA